MQPTFNDSENSNTQYVPINRKNDKANMSK
jgi:hypothetical protein